MKRISMVLFLMGALLVSTLSGCTNPATQLQDALLDYTKMVEGNCPDDLHLTIYYLDPDILTRKPLSAEELIGFPGTQKISVESEELKIHFERLKKLKPSILQPIKETSYVDARLYYIFEIGESDKVLEVIISTIHDSVFVNGVEVENNPVFYELIEPFLTEEAHNTLGI